jgi:hypothetical protein
MFLGAVAPATLDVGTAAVVIGGYGLGSRRLPADNPRMAPSSAGTLPGDDRGSRNLGRAAIIAVAALALVAAKPAHGPGAVYIAGQVRNAKLGFAFDIPEGLQAEQGSSRGLYWIGPAKGGTPLVLWAIDRPYWFLGPLADPSDTLASFVKQNFGMDCDADGPDGSSHADSLIQMNRFLTAHGLEAVEYSVRVIEERGEGGSEEKSDSKAVATPKATPKVASKTVRVGGPFYIVDLSRPGKPLWVRISPGCSKPADAATIHAARAFVSSLQRI